MGRRGGRLACRAPMRLRSSLLIACVAVPLALWVALLPRSSGDRATRPSSTARSIAPAQIGRKKAPRRCCRATSPPTRAGSTRCRATSRRCRHARQRLQRDLDAKRAELEACRRSCAPSAARSSGCSAGCATRARSPTRLVEIFKADKPDIITVVLESTDFADLLERTEFMRAHLRPGPRSSRSSATRGRGDADRGAAAALEKRQAQITAIVAAPRDEIAAVKDELVDAARLRDGPLAQDAALRRVALASPRPRGRPRRDAAAQPAKIARPSSSATATAPAGPISRARAGSSGRSTARSPRRSASRAPGILHAGMDIAVPEGTPIRAAAAGRVALMQGAASSGGYGNFTCVQHDATLSTCYAHQSRFGISMGAVSQGQVIGYRQHGPLLRPHLHFETRINGRVVNPMSYL